MFFTLTDLWPFLLLPTTLICLSQPLSGVACSNEWPWHHWGSTDWKWKDLGVSGTDAWALPGSICCCGCCMNIFFANLTGCTMDARFPHQSLILATVNPTDSSFGEFLSWRKDHCPAWAQTTVDPTVWYPQQSSFCAQPLNQNTNLATWQAQLEPKNKLNLGFEFWISYFFAVTVTIFDVFCTCFLS